MGTGSDGNGMLENGTERERELERERLLERERKRKCRERTGTVWLP